MSPLEPEPVSTGPIALEVDGTVLAAFSEVSGLALELEVVETEQAAADGRMVVRRLPGRPKAGEVTPIRGLTSKRASAALKGGSSGVLAERLAISYESVRAA